MDRHQPPLTADQARHETAQRAERLAIELAGLHAHHDRLQHCVDWAESGAVAVVGGTALLVAAGVYLGARWIGAAAVALGALGLWGLRVAGRHWLRHQLMLAAQAREVEEDLQLTHIELAEWDAHIESGSDSREW